MKVRSPHKKYLIKQIILLAVLLVLVVTINVITQDSSIIESQYSRKIYPLISVAINTLFSYIPFSLGDVLYATIVLFGIYLFIDGVRLLLRKDWRGGLYRLSNLINICLALYVVFYVSWGFNYYRKPLAENMQLSTDSLKLADYLVVLHDFIDSTNTLRAHVETKQRIDYNDIAPQLQQLVRNDTTFQGVLASTYGIAKSPISSHFSSYFGVSGYFNPFTHEAQVNRAMPLLALPFTYVHELAHQQGIGFEDEANFIAFERLRRSPNKFFRYSAYFQTSLYMLRELSGIDTTLYKENRSRLSEPVRRDIAEERAFWTAYTGWINDVSGIFYDSYLKHNNQEEGMSRYDRMTRLVLASELKRRKCL